MAQFGIHALIALYFICVVPVFGPSISRSSFCVGLFIGSVFPDLDVYPAAIMHFVKPSLESNVHRTLTHSVITAVVLFFLMWCVELIFTKKYEQFVYDYSASVNNPNFGNKAYRQRYDILGTYKTRTANYKAFGGGLFIGIITHCMLDIVVWFSPIDLLYPLSNFNLTTPVNVWADFTPPDLAIFILTLSELFFYGLYLSMLRLKIVYKLGKWIDIPPADVNMNLTDTDIEHGAMPYSTASFKDIICPLDPNTLVQAKKYLKVIKILEIFQYIYFTIVTVLSVVLFSSRVVQIIVYSEILVVCVPSFYVLAWKFQKVLLLKME